MVASALGPASHTRSTDSHQPWWQHLHLVKRSEMCCYEPHREENLCSPGFCWFHVSLFLWGESRDDERTLLKNTWGRGRVLHDLTLSPGRSSCILRHAGRPVAMSRELLEPFFFLLCLDGEGLHLQHIRT